MTRDEKAKWLRFLRSHKNMMMRAMRRAAPTAVLAVSTPAGAQVALADQPGRVQISFETGGLKAEALEAEAFQVKSLTAEELTDVRGAGLEPSSLGRGGRRDPAVILFDELGGKRGGRGSTKLSHDEAKEGRTDPDGVSAVVWLHRQTQRR